MCGNLAVGEQVHSFSGLPMSILKEESPSHAKNQRCTKIQKQAEVILRKSAYAQLHRVRCEVVDRTLFLRGDVSSFHIKQMAQEELRDIEGIDQIYNFVQVVSESELRESTDGN